MAFRATHTLFQLFCASIVTMMTFQSPSPLKQMLFASSWLVAGLVIGRVWASRD